jgi:hypothetical protein
MLTSSVREIGRGNLLAVGRKQYDEAPDLQHSVMERPQGEVHEPYPVHISLKLLHFPVHPSSCLAIFVTGMLVHFRTLALLL